MDMSERIKERRIAMGLTQTELGEKLNLQKSAIAKYENGRVENIKRSVIQQMAKILECSPAYLMGWTDNLNKSNANLVVDMLSDKNLLEHIGKLKDLTKEHQQTIFDNIDFLYEKEGH